MRQLLPARARVGLERLRQLVNDVSIALSNPTRPPSQECEQPDSALRDAPAARAAPTPEPNSLPKDDAETDTESRVIFEHLGQEVMVGPEQSILDAGREAGLDLDFSCTVGGCAACALQIVEGEVVYDVPTCLTEDEVDSGMCLACVGRPDGELVLTARR